MSVAVFGSTTALNCREEPRLTEAVFGPSACRPVMVTLETLVVPTVTLQVAVNT